MLADIGIAVLLLIGVYCFLRVLGWRTSIMTRSSTRRAEDLYDQYGDSLRKQRAYAKDHGGDWKDEPGSSRDPSLR
jgi:hypothetical protein